MAGGRPTKYKKEYCKSITPFMSKGKSGVQFAAHIGVCKDTIHQWCKDYPEFSEAYKEAMTACESYWENIIQVKSVTKQPGSDGLLTLLMKNRFKWSEKTTSEITSEAKVTFTTQIGDDGVVQREET